MTPKKVRTEIAHADAKWFGRLHFLALGKVRITSGSTWPKRMGGAIRPISKGVFIMIFCTGSGRLRCGSFPIAPSSVHISIARTGSKWLILAALSQAEVHFMIFCTGSKWPAGVSLPRRWGILRAPVRTRSGRTAPLRPSADRKHVRLASTAT